MSSDNFKRDPEEVQGLLDQMTCFFQDFLLIDASVDLMGVRIRVTGDQSILPPTLRKAIADVEEATKNNTKLNFQIAINYGGREEIVHAVKHAIKSLCSDDLATGVDKLTAAHINSGIYSAQFGLPPVDAILRTSGEKRLSGFHLWESMNAELVFVQPKWPELDEVTFLRAAVELSMRNRRHGL
jgi:undecaprenyl diphosphate synthase